MMVPGMVPYPLPTRYGSYFAFPNTAATIPTNKKFSADDVETLQTNTTTTTILGDAKHTKLLCEREQLWNHFTSENMCHRCDTYI
eukprot:scaffold1872_cov262-Amphora_coffeaeformis.AAC.5